MKRLLILLLVFLCTACVPGVSSAGVESRSADSGRSEIVDSANYELASKWTQARLWGHAHYLYVTPAWQGEGDRFIYRYRTSRGLGYYLVDCEKKTKKVLFDRSKLASALSGFTSGVFDEKSLALRELRLLEGGPAFAFTAGDSAYSWDPRAGRLEWTGATPQPPAADEWKNISPDGKAFLTIHDNGLYAGDMDAPDSLAVLLSSDMGEFHGFHIDASTQQSGDSIKRARPQGEWSPDSRFFMIRRSDYREVEDLWLIDHLAEPRPKLKTYKCSMPSEELHDESLWVYDRESGRLIEIDTRRWDDQTLTDLFEETVFWGRDSSKIFFIRRSRDYFMVDLCSADPATGKSRVLVEERLEAQIMIRPPVEIEKTGEFLWWSSRDGWGHFYLYDSEGRLKNQVTKGYFNVERCERVDEKGRVLFFMANGREEGRNPYLRHLYRVKLDGRGMKLLTPVDTDHEAIFTSSGKYFIDNHSRADVFPVSQLRDEKGGLVMDLEESDVSGFEEAGFIFPEIFSAKAADGETDLWGVMYKPFDLDPARKYPVVTRVYPGKQDEYIPFQFTPWGRETYLAQLGFIVVVFGNRGGTDCRSLEYKEFGRENMRDYGLEDKKVVIEQLAGRFEYIDVDRVGIYGHSSGGFMTVSAMLQYPDFFKVGVSSAGLQDGNTYYNIWNERYAGVKMVTGPGGDISWESVRTPNNIEIAGQLEGRLLLIQGMMDDNLHPFQTFRLAQALIEAGKRFDLFVVPSADHSFLRTFDYMSRLRCHYFVEHLMGDKRRNVDIFGDETFED